MVELIIGRIYSSCLAPEGQFLVRDKPYSKLVTFSSLIRRELLQGIFGHLQIRYELVVRLCKKLMTNSLQAYTKSD
jgi:hypothetical protein